MSSVNHNQALYRIVITHYLAAAICFLILAILFVLSIDTFSGHYFQPKLLALTHIAALGWGTMMIFGALYQLLPVIMETNLFSIRLCWFSFVLFTPGSAMLVHSFWVFETGICMQVGGIMILTAIILFGINVFLTVKHAARPSVAQDFITTSCLWLCLTALLGVLLVFNFQYSLLPADHMHFLRLHAHMGIAGWFLMLIIGISGKLVPMFLLSKYKKTYLLDTSYYLINISLLCFLVDGYYNGINIKTYFIMFLGLAGIGCYLVYIYQCFISRLRKHIDLPMVTTLVSFVLFTLAILVLPFIIYYHLKGNPLAVNLSVGYGDLLFIGWISALILGQTFKTLPFIVWVKHYEHLTGKVKTPLPADLINGVLLKIQFIAFIVFLLSFFGGLIFSVWLLECIGATSLMITASSYCIHLLCLLFHQTKTETYDRL